MIDRDFVKEYDMLPAGSRVLCAVSGGADSMCLLHWLHSQAEALNIQVLAAHFEHGLRGEESLRDARFVEDFCRKEGIPFFPGQGEVSAFARVHKLSVEDAARQLRYAFLEETARAQHCQRIATAHNADDQAETLLLHLCRGSGARGLCGIPPRRGLIVRPLLETSRAEIEAYLQANGIAHVEDSSNNCGDFSRNRIRLQVCPQLRQINPAFVRSAGRTAKLLRQDEDCLEGLARDFIARHFDGESLELQALSSLHRALSSRVIRLLWPEALSMEQLEAVLSLCRGSEYASLDLPGGKIRREQGRLWFREEPLQELESRELRPGDCLELKEAGLRLRLKQTVCTGEIHGLFNTYRLKCESIKGVIRCTGRRDGDRYRPQGRGCSKSLKSLFLEAGMTRRERLLCPVLRDDLGILAVYGFAADERCRPEPGDTVLEIQIEKYELGE